MADDIQNAMNLDEEPQRFIFVDEGGNERPFESVGSMAIDEVTYMAFLPYVEDPEAEMELELVVMQIVPDANGDGQLAPIEDDELYESVCERFIAQIIADCECDCDDEDCDCCHGDEESDFEDGCDCQSDCDCDEA